MNKKNLKAILDKIGKIRRIESKALDGKKLRANINNIKRKG